MIATKILARCVLLRRQLPLLLILASITTGCEQPPTAAVVSRPNILLIVMDDFGYNDLGANGNPATPTPNLNKFAAEGERYTRHYADATCSVSRVGILTGTYPARYGLRPNHLGLSKDTPTIASALRDVGYHTEHIGKWHVASATEEQSPMHLGFDAWFGFDHQNLLAGESKDGIHFRTPQYLNPWLRENYSPPVQYPGHLENILTDRAIAFLGQHKNDASAQPWFLNLWFFAPHAPIRAADEFRSKYPNDAAGAYHALIDQLDTNIGRVLQALDNNGQRENTLVIVLSDNGGTNQQVNNNYPFYGKKTEFYEGGVRTPLLMRWPGHLAKNIVSDEPVSIYDIFPTIAAASAAKLPEYAIGRNLLNEDRRPLPELYWEYSSRSRFTYSVLSVDGRWRLTDNVFDVASLNDLQTDPTGEANVIADHPQIAAQLRQNYLNWRKQARVVNFAYEPLNERGGAILRGTDLLRSPGYAGFTFAIGVTPPNKGDDMNGDEARHASEPQTILEQSGRWRVQSAADNSISLEVLGQSINIPPLPAGRCSELVLSTYYMFNTIQPADNNATISVYVNGNSVSSSTQLNPKIQTWGYGNPTYVGFGANGEGAYQGKLSRPVILNEFVVPDSEGEKIGNGISAVGASCGRT